MASLLDISLLSHFQDIFVILFVFTAAYAILMAKGTFSKDKGINALLAFGIAAMFLFSQDAISIIKDTVPWFVIMLIVLTMTLFVSQSIGSGITPTFLAQIGTWVLVISIIILVINIGQRFGQSAGPFLSGNITDPDNVVAGGSGDVGSGDFSQNFSATIFHPKVLAMILILLVSLFSVLLVGYWI